MNGDAVHADVVERCPNEMRESWTQPGMENGTFWSLCVRAQVHFNVMPRQCLPVQSGFMGCLVERMPCRCSASRSLVYFGAKSSTTSEHAIGRHL